MKFAFYFLMLLATGIKADFINSFVSSYDIFPQGRYSRGYPNYLAEKSRTSLVQLEDAIKNKGFDISGRFIISGYEQNAVPSYKFAVEDKAISDESSVKGNSGWSFAPGNMFGFTTGFLLKDVGSFKNNSVFRHVGVDTVEIFADDSELLQKNAFGESFQLINEFKRHIEKNISNANTKAVLKLLIEYWKSIYSDEKQSHNAAVVATQDILFSIMYATYLYESDIKINKFFTGPDVTYPIRVLPIQPLEATANSQSFLKEFVNLLGPVDDEKTAYIFCSFVDGVGKSTLLGNIVNWLKYKDNFVKYESVNNSSSQLATIYDVSEKAVIVDLPAQISHFCAKPDGYVFVDIDSCRLSKELVGALVKYIGENIEPLFGSFINNLAAVSAGKPIECKNKFYQKYIENILSLGVDSKWIPIDLEQQLFVVNFETNKIRMLVSLDQAHSSGLKVREPELMIFDGAIMPMKYDVFLDDLTKRMGDQGVKKVVFVDFTSMYPRSSRENVRINFMLQQLKALFGNKFDITKSFYRDFANNFELYPLLNSDKAELTDAFVLEVLSRASLDDFIVQDAQDDIKKLSFDELIVQMQKKIASLSKSSLNSINGLIEAKLDAELDKIENFKYSKTVESCWACPLQKVADLSLAMRDIFAYKIHDGYLNTHWASLDTPVSVDYMNGLVSFASGAVGTILLAIDQNSHSSEDMEKLASALRATYFDTALALLNGQTIGESNCFPLIFFKNERSFLLVQKNIKYSVPIEKYMSIKTYVGKYLYGYDPEAYGSELVGVTCNVKYSQANIDRSGDDYFVSPHQIVKFFDRYDYQTYLQEKYPHNDSGQHLDNGSIGLLLTALATVDVIIKHPKAEIMAMYGNHDDFVATLRLLEALFISRHTNMNMINKLFSSYDSVEPIIKIDWQAE